MSSTVHVKGIGAQTSEKEVREFFSFCGKISSISVTPESDSADASKSATVTFEKETAAKTALLLDNTQLGSSSVSVTGAASLDQIAGGKTAGSADETNEKGEYVAQEDKPRSRIAAEYLAHGYVLSDKAIQRALDLDKQHGISQRFTNALTQFDSKYKVTERAAATDKQYGVSQRAGQGWASLSSYFEQAASTPTGQKLRNFYDQGQKQVLDVHNEAKHLAGLNTPQKAQTSSTGVSAEEAEMEKVTVDGQERTKCNCGGTDAKCPCEPGKCSCSGCSKN